MRGDDMTNAARRNGIEVRSGHEQIARPGDDNRDRGMRPVQVFVDEVPDLTEDQLATQVERQREMETTTPAADRRPIIPLWKARQLQAQGFELGDEVVIDHDQYKPPRERIVASSNRAARRAAAKRSRRAK